MQITAPARGSALVQLGGTARLMLSLPPDMAAAGGQLRAVFAGFALTLAAGCSDDPAGDGWVPLRPVSADVRATGEARLAGGDRLELRVEGLPVRDGAYEVWLFNSASDAVGLARVARGSFSIRVRLPKDPARYRWLDVSSEPLDGNPNHSGASLLRARVAGL
jgi:Anti-sigma-K factor rskA